MTDVISTGNATRYKVQLNDGSLLQPHTDHCTPYGLAQFINCCLSSNSPIDWIEGQNMQTKQCKLITNLHHDLRISHPHMSKSSSVSNKTMSCYSRMVMMDAKRLESNCFVFLCLYCLPLLDCFLNYFID